jgi:thiamine biosynthesis lipoprotein
MTADAAATAIFVAGPDEWERVADRLGIRAVLRVDRSGRIEMTASMRDRFQADADEPSDIIVSAH